MEDMNVFNDSTKMLNEDLIAKRRQQNIEKFRKKRESQTLEQRIQAAKRVQEFSYKLKGIDIDKLKYEGILKK